nr:DUF2283 domain-containing protein [Leptothoe spongobia]
MADRCLLGLSLRPGKRYFIIGQCSPYVEQESEEISDAIVARLNPNSGAVENLEILFFSKRLTANEKIELPIEMVPIVD